MINALINAAVDRSRTIFLLLLLVFIVGLNTYHTVPKEAEPDVRIPIIYVAMTHEGISPEDAERLLLRPMEKELQSIEGIKEMRSNASEGHASVILEFDAGFDNEKALDDVREKVDLARPELPEDTEEPRVHEINLSLFPVVSVILTGDAEERTLLKLARDLRDRIESIPNVLSVNIAGDREEVLEVLVDPFILESYSLSPIDVLEFLRRNNVLVSAGSLDTGNGRYAIKLPGLLESLDEFYSLPVKASGDTVVTVGDIAQIRRTFKDTEGYARVNGRPSVALEVSKRLGSNMIETIAAVRELVEEERSYWSDGIEVVYAQDRSERVIDRLNDLQNNVMLAVFLVLVVIISVMGVRSAGLVAVAIPGAFLFGVMLLGMLGITMNIVVLFSLILSIGMLVDSAIVVCEYADRRMVDGMSPREAYPEAARRMAWPIIASTITTLIVFLPLLVWPGIVGQFMRYMPITLIMTLTGSMLMALIFMPTLGAWFGRSPEVREADIRAMRAAEEGDLADLGGFTRRYTQWLGRALSAPKRVVASMTVGLLVIFGVYAAFGTGVEFFPDIEPENISVHVHARGNLSVDEKDAVIREVEGRLQGLEGVAVTYARSGKTDVREAAEDVVGVIQMELKEWNERDPAREIISEIERRTHDMAGISVEVMQQKPGPKGNKPIEIEFRSRSPELLAPSVEKALAAMQEVGGFTAVEDTRPIPAIEWELQVDREMAGKYGITIEQAGNFVKLVTNGIVASTYRPDDADDEIDIKVRFPRASRNVSQIDRLRVITPEGAVPLSHFVTRLPKPKLGQLERVDGERVLKIKADVKPGILPDNKVREMAEWFAKSNWDPRVRVRFAGEREDQQEAANFLRNAFVLALFAMALVMVTQFNSIYRMVVVMSAVVFSTGGVLIGLLLMGHPFGIVMCGVGVISLAGIVVNNNIIFIDTFKALRDQGMEIREALLRTGAQRLRPILLTAGTTVLGLLPMVFKMNIDFMSREITFNAPSSQWWVQLSTTIAGGLAFATVLTLFFTPCLLMIGDQVGQWLARRRGAA